MNAERLLVGLQETVPSEPESHASFTRRGNALTEYRWTKKSLYRPQGYHFGFLFALLRLALSISSIQLLLYGPMGHMNCLMESKRFELEATAKPKIYLDGCT